MAKVESLYGTTPAEIFQSGLERNEQIEAVAACVLWKDGTVTAGWRRGRGALLVPRHEVHGHLHVAMSEGAGTSRPASRRWYVRWWGFCRRRAEARKERI